MSFRCIYRVKRLNYADFKSTVEACRFSKMTMIDENNKVGTVYLVGAGPGSADLLTLRACALIEAADVIVYDRLICDEVIALFPDAAKTVYVGKSTGKHTLCQAEINRLLIELAQKHSCVVRLKGGDPFVFGRGGEEYERNGQKRWREGHCGELNLLFLITLQNTHDL